MNLIKSTKLKLLIGVLAGVLVVIIILSQQVKKLPANLEITGTIPANQDYFNPNQPVELIFNQPVNLSVLAVETSPKTEIVLLLGEKSNQVLVRPKDSWQSETNYSLTVKLAKPYTLNFITEVQAGNSSGWNEAFIEELEKEVEANKPQYDGLRNIRRAAPIYQNGFNITYSYRNNTYTIALSPPYEESKTKAIKWFNDQGVTDFTYVRIDWQELQ